MPRGAIAAVATVYVAAVGIALLIVGIYVGHAAWQIALAMGASTAAIAALTVALVWPRLRRLEEATAVARALADERFDARMRGTGAPLGPLAAALNAAGDQLGRVIERLNLERAQLEALLNASSDATVGVDRGSRIVFMNDAAAGMFGLAGREIGRAFIEAVRDHDLNAQLVAAAQQGERSVRVVAYGPAQRWLQATAVPIAGGGDWAALAVIHDLTEVRRLDSVRRDFISNVSHELRTPLAGIRAAAETLQEGAIDDPAAAAEFLGHIQRETDRMTQLVEELLELSRIESGAAPMRFEQVDATTIVRESVARFAHQAERAGIALRADVGGAALPVPCDAERLEQALGNLIANAIKFTPAGGSVAVRASVDDGDVTIGVSDTGIGIEPEQQARVFERFYKADKGRGGGTGLGLAIVKHIVLAHGGSVAVESRPGHGSTFTMRLPRR